ncbi:ATP-grasp domain-containing protein [Xanthomarina gelatinilytica]|uniref:ATP-grasp domain-containing protein n=1 Tax=Xanthomarina gelatinilytica TaxID=1137281 RepID=UPI003AA8F474
MKLAIHHRPGSFSDRWIAHCKQENIDYKIVNCFDNDIIDQIEDCDALMWHHHHGKYKDVLAAKKVLFALEHTGIKVFPDFKTAWHFDDKVAQKYLLEAIDAPLVPSYVFYDKAEAIKWANQTTYPKVFKLKGGAGSANVKLVRTKSECIKLINKAFGTGFKQFDGKAYFLDTIKKYKSGTKSFQQVAKSFGRMLTSTEYAKNSPPERGYVYFQDFIPDNDSDIRIIIVGSKAFGLKRMVRKNDFRASGSGTIKYSVEEIDDKCVEIAFQVNKKIKSQSIAFDFVFDQTNKPLIVEISYAYSTSAYDKCEGYWTEDFQFHKGSFTPQVWMAENIIKNKG